MIKTVLIVDDDPTMLLIICEMLQLPPYIHVLTAENLERARSLCETHDMDLIICDFHLQDGNGKEFLDFLLKKKIKTTFILFTGSLVFLKENPRDILTFSITGKDLVVLKKTVQNLLPLI